MTRPRLADGGGRDYCAQGAMHLLREREARYPALVTAGKLTPDAAAIGLERARIIVAQWQWVIDPNGPYDLPWDAERCFHGFGAYDFELAQELTAAAQRARAIAARKPADADAAELADLYEALAWLQGEDGNGGTARIVRTVRVERRVAAAARGAEPERRAA